MGGPEKNDTGRDARPHPRLRERVRKTGRPVTPVTDPHLFG